ncbi:MAG: ATP-dependent sacrificial sulfur transferase LarE [Oscillospiraceae bacterium]|jgi:uncharacterized protein|nr:ATP-dependent sacrificial sulfur transferase LarE [Oscillospiraceae bacterium]
MPEYICTTPQAELEAKLAALKAHLAEAESLTVAFSSGVDSTFLLTVAHDVLGDRVAAVTARSCSFPKRELDAAADFCRERGIRHVVVESEELEIEGFSHNPKNRCYLCKSELFSKIWDVTKQLGFKNVAEGSNLDDDGDYRPGLIAVAEAHALSPLRAAGLTKAEIRELSRQMKLPTWDKQSFACLSSRFPYGDEITEEKLRMVDLAEQFLLDSGFLQVRVRIHGTLARIETDAEGFALLADAGLRERVHIKLRAIGFTYVSLDLLGYRTGSMNEVL